jgi:hypothetical protein
MEKPNVDGFLATALYGNSDLGLDGDTSDPEAVLFDPVAGVLERAQIDHAFKSAADRGSCSVDFLKTSGIETDVDSEEFQLDVAPAITKDEPVASRITFAKRMGITRTEENISDGAKWMHMFNDAGECVRTQFLGRAE